MEINGVSRVSILLSFRYTNRLNAVLTSAKIILNALFAISSIDTQWLTMRFWECSFFEETVIIYMNQYWKRLVVCFWRWQRIGWWLNFYIFNMQMIFSHKMLIYTTWNWSFFVHAFQIYILCFVWCWLDFFFFFLSFAKPLINVFDVLVLITKSIYFYCCWNFMFCVLRCVLLFCFMRFAHCNSTDYL